jgi:hypothetical protein
MQVVARRTGAAPTAVRIGDNPVDLFFGGIFRLIGFDWSAMDAVGDATCSRPPIPTVPIAICIDTCAPGVIDPSGTLLYWSPYASEVTPGDVGIAWTSFNTSSQEMEQDVILQSLCGGSSQNICDLSIFTNNGYINSLARQFRCAFKNPLYDSDKKTCSDGTCDSILDNVTSWDVLAPLLSSPDGCPPGDQPDPETVVGYAEISILEVYASGGGGTNDCACNAFDAPNIPGSTPNAILVNNIVCTSCPADDILGSKPKLVQ